MSKSVTDLRIVKGAPSPLARLVDDYLVYCKAKGLSPKTVKGSYGYPLLHVFVPWAAENGIESVEQLASRDMDRLSAELIDAGGKRGTLRTASVWTYMKAVKRFLSWAGAEGENVKAEARLPKLQRRMVEILSQQELTKLEDLASTERDKLIVRLLAETGIRRAELAALSVRDLTDESGRNFLLVHGKGGKDRKVPVAPALARRLRRYINGRPAAVDTNRLFLARRRPGGAVEALTDSGVTQMITSLGERADLGKRITPHLFRHTAATLMLRRGMDSILVAQVLGHSSLQMIQRTYSHLTPTDAHTALMKALQATDDE
jgi:integrase/recombinase XerD